MKLAVLNIATSIVVAMLFARCSGFVTQSPVDLTEQISQSSLDGAQKTPTEMKPIKDISVTSSDAFPPEIPQAPARIPFSSLTEKIFRVEPPIVVMSPWGIRKHMHLLGGNAWGGYFPMKRAAPLGLYVQQENGEWTLKMDNITSADNSTKNGTTMFKLLPQRQLSKRTTLPKADIHRGISRRRAYDVPQIENRICEITTVLCDALTESTSETVHCIHQYFTGKSLNLFTDRKLQNLLLLGPRQFRSLNRQCILKDSGYLIDVIIKE